MKNLMNLTALVLIGGSLVACDSSSVVPADQLVADLSAAKFTINNDESFTKDPVLKIKNYVPADIAQMKISSDSGCNSGDWVPFDPNIEVVTPKVNGTATLSAQYQDLSGQVSTCVVKEIEHDNPNTAELCEDYPDMCDRNSKVEEVGVVTILLALGDELNNKLIVNGSSAQVIAETSVRFATPVKDPKILVVRDRLNSGESYNDTAYIANTLLENYSDVTLMDEPVDGINYVDLLPYDLVWFNNPGFPMGQKTSRDALIAFQGGVILSGDDMSWGREASGEMFSMQDLTGLKSLDNGTHVKCNGETYWHDGNQGYQYQVLLDGNRLPDYPEEAMFFVYGNDIDNTSLAKESAEVISWAHGGAATCNELRPVITRYSLQAAPN